MGSGSSDLKGVRGVQGVQGSKGVQGFQGSRGVRGFKGLRCVQGFKAPVHDECQDKVGGRRQRKGRCVHYL